MRYSCKSFALAVILGLLLVAAMGEENLSAPSGREFTVMAYNVENLFDIDRVSPYDDYVEDPTNPDSYSPGKLLRKLKSISKVFQSVSDGKGPDLVLLNELEVDHTPETKVADLNEFLKKYEGTTYEKMLTTELTDELRGLPAEAWLLKALEDEGFKGYRIVVGEVPASAGAHEDAIKSGILTKFPVLHSQTIDTASARGVVEVTVDIGGTPFTLMANHWKSGAGNPAMENTRLGNAATLRKRLDEILAKDPQADVILGGDFNSHYNQAQRYSFMPKTALQDVLGSQGNEKAMLDEKGPVLYNLWFDLSEEKRFSDEYDGEWGTLIQLLITRGLYDGKGVITVDNSLQQVIVPKINCHEELTKPWSWTNFGTGWGASDHFPVLAKFRTVPAGAGESANLGHLESGGSAPSKAVPVGYDKLDRSKLKDAKSLAQATPEELAQAMGGIFLLNGNLSKKVPLTVEIEGKSYGLHAYDKNLNTAMRVLPKGAPVHWIGELGVFKGKLQFVIQDPSWIK